MWKHSNRSWGLPLTRTTGTRPSPRYCRPRPWPTHTTRPLLSSVAYSALWLSVFFFSFYHAPQSLLSSLICFCTHILTLTPPFHLFFISLFCLFLAFRIFIGFSFPLLFSLTFSTFPSVSVYSSPPSLLIHRPHLGSSSSSLHLFMSSCLPLLLLRSTVSSCHSFFFPLISVPLALFFCSLPHIIFYHSDFTTPLPVLSSGLKCPVFSRLPHF